MPLDDAPGRSLLVSPTNRPEIEPAGNFRIEASHYSNAKPADLPVVQSINVGALCPEYDAVATPLPSRLAALVEQLETQKEER
jgi:hypothetical protein